MTWQPNIKLIDRKENIFCDWRRKYVRLTPEEWVRQHFLHYLVEDMSYPKSLIAVEHSISVGMLSKRCDAVVLSDTLMPLCIIEFKAESVSLSQKVFDQVAVYNQQLNVAYFIVSNGSTTFACLTDSDGYTFLPHIPSYTELCNQHV